MRTDKWIVSMLAAVTLLMVGCKEEDDIIVYKDSRRWVEKTVAVVAPLSDPIMKARIRQRPEIVGPTAR